MKYLSVILILLSASFSYADKRRSTMRRNINRPIESVNNFAKDSIVYKGKLIYLSCELDSLILFYNVKYDEFHIYDDCICIGEGKINSLLLIDSNPKEVKQKICPSCERKANFIKSACDSIISRQLNFP